MRSVIHPFSTRSGLALITLLLVAVGVLRVSQTLPINQALIAHLQEQTADILSIRCHETVDGRPTTDDRLPLTAYRLPITAHRTQALLTTLDGRCHQAFLHWREHLSSQPDDRLGWLMLGKVQQLWGNQLGATTAFQLAGAAPLFAARAEQATDPLAAAQWMNIAAGISPDVGYTLELARLYLAAGKAEQAEAVLSERQESTTSESVESLKLEAALAETREEWAAAIAVYQRLLAQLPDDYTLLQRAKGAAEQAGDRDQAVAITERLIQLRYGDVGWWMLEAARLETQRGNYEQADVWLTTAEPIYLGEPWLVAFYRGQTACAAGDLPRAIANFDHARAEQPSNWQIPATQALCLRQLTGDLGRALPLLQEAADLGNGRPETRQVQLTLEQWYQEMGEEIGD